MQDDARCEMGIIFFCVKNLQMLFFILIFVVAKEIYITK
jgi:hypothetical protein